MPDDELIIFDGRQSETAAAVQRGVSRMLSMAGFATLPEFPLVSGRRADIIAVNDRGGIWIIEIKSSVADFRADNKWPEYWEYCDQLYFAVPPDLPQDILPGEAGLIVADAWGAEILRQPEPQLLAGARRKAVTLRFARAAALRLHSVYDPKVAGLLRTED
ncbi:MAG: MmcB family DNA repair protein [Hyphomicrobiales bacterium]|nr:MmcB family DNA repair protein [Hyphomicrobiales bacterium]